MRKTLYTILILIAVSIMSCSQSASSPASPQEVIDIARSAAGFPQSDLTDMGTTTMSNSPRGDLPVEQYQDDEGRIFYVEPETNTVVEIDGRALLEDTHGESNGQPLSEPELSARAEEIVRAIVPDFESVKGQLRYEAGVKVKVYFYSWYGQTTEGDFMPPFIQVGLTDSGMLFAFYNTVSMGQ